MQKRFLRAAGATALLGLASAAHAATGSIQYAITELGVLPGDTVGFANGINDAGQVVGFSSQSTDARFGPHHAYIYSNGQMGTLGISPGTESQFEAINDSGQIAGQINSIPAVFYNGQVATINYGYPGGLATAINNAGLATGFSYLNSSNYHAFVCNISGGTTTDLNPAGWPDSNGVSINSSGQIVGGLYNGSTNSFLYKNGQLTNLTTTTGLYAVTVIADSGEFAGYQTSGQGYYDKGAGLVSLGPGAGFTDEYPRAINSAGVMVGTLDNFGTSNHAFIDTGTSIVDLNTLIDPASGWTLDTAQDINNQGQIVGQGTDASGNVRGYILTPIGVPEPSTMAALACLGLSLRRKRMTAGTSVR